MDVRTHAQIIICGIDGSPPGPSSRRPFSLSSPRVISGSHSSQWYVRYHNINAPPFLPFAHATYLSHELPRRPAQWSEFPSVSSLSASASRSPKSKMKTGTYLFVSQPRKPPRQTKSPCRSHRSKSSETSPRVSRKTALRRPQHPNSRRVWNLQTTCRVIFNPHSPPLLREGTHIAPRTIPDLVRVFLLLLYLVPIPGSIISFHATATGRE